MEGGVQMKVGKIRGKVAAKVAKTKAKVADRTGKQTAAEVAKTAMVLFALALVGCASTGEQPARSQTQHNDFRNCVIIVAAKADANLDTMKVKAESEEKGMPTIDLFTQAQANDGSETISPHASPTNTTDVDAALDVPVNKMNSGTSAAGGAAERLLGAGADWLSGKLNGSSTSTTAAATTQSASSGDCKDGSCTAGGACTDGSCSYTK